MSTAVQQGSRGPVGWQPGAMSMAGRTGNSFGGDAQYGQISFNPPGAFTSQIQRNPRCEQRNW
jgi:hypothetical protein